MKKFLLIALAPLALITIALNGMEGQGTPCNGLKDFLVKSEKRKVCEAFNRQKTRSVKKTKHKSNNSSSKAADSPQQQLAKLLIKIKKNSVNEVESILELSNLPINAKYSDGKTALMMAIIHSNNRKIAELLVNHGAHINAKDNHGNTALTYAAKKKDPSWVDYLKFVGAQDNSESNQQACTITEQPDFDNKEMSALQPFLTPRPHNKRRTSSSALEALKRKKERIAYLKQKEQKAELRLQKKLMIIGEDPN
jgi:hypothetical protein